ncbi:hypothetical protein F4778DRAFT_357656 [Xylariomycetidae sp. FL2044]|nr:hypothetical protein F4778DRAFT_357656 [Xylariomycetidae sp. FL2044]
MSAPNGESASAGGHDSSPQDNDNSPVDTTMSTAPTLHDNNNVPKPKRLACMICRKRKLKCDGVKPSCSTCTRLGHSCAYDEVRKKSGPKRGYVKALEERLKQVETLLNKTQEPSTSVTPEANQTPSVPFESAQNQQANNPVNFAVPNPSIGIASDRDMDRWRINGESPQATGLEDFNFSSNIGLGMNGMDPSFTWEMIGLGLEEPLPPQETIDELHQIYFEKVHPSIPMIHRYRYLAAMNLAPNQRPPVALRYAIWTHACAIDDKYSSLKDLFYQRARKYVEADYIKGYGEHMISVAHCQTHVLLASYEFKMMYFPRAWMSTGSAVRLSQMIGLHRLDGAGLDVKQCLPPPRDWTEREERRRTFWMAFAEDRYASIGTGWPMTVDERDIMTNLPSSEEAFNLSRPEQTQTLEDSMSPSGAAKLSPFGGIVLMACLFGRNLVHLHRPDVDDRDHDMNGEFWKRHRTMDNILLNTSLCLPSHLKLPSGLGNPNIVFTNMNIHTSTICLHQAAIFKADRNRLPPSVSAESKVRCITAANEIASTMRMVSHMDLSAMNPFISFCLYVAARVFIQYLKSRPDDSQTADALRFILSAMNALKRKNPLTESFLVQLDVDLEALAMRIPKLKDAFPRSRDSPGVGHAMHLKNFGHKKPDGTAGEPALPDCGIMKMAKDDGNPMACPDLVNPEPQSHVEGNHINGYHLNSGQGPSDLSAANYFGDQQQLPNRGRGSADGSHGGLIPEMTFSSRGFVESQSSENNDMSVSSHPEGQSNRPTPNSSNESDYRQNGTGTGTGTRRSFDDSPIGNGHQNMGTTTQAEMDAATAAAFFSLGSDQTYVSAMANGSSGGNSNNNSSSNNDFGAPNGWGLSAGQAGMSPMTESALRNLMNMNEMDMGWDTTGA